jgi:hypothetical protein
MDRVHHHGGRLAVREQLAADGRGQRAGVDAELDRTLRVERLALD